MGIYYGQSFKPPRSYSSYSGGDFSGYYGGDSGQAAPGSYSSYGGGISYGTDGSNGNTPPRATAIANASSGTPGAPAAPGAPPPPPKPQLPDLSHLDFSNDPILLRIQALTKQQTAQSEANALAARRQLAIGYGDPALAQQLGLGKDVAGQAGGNTFGTLQELQRGYGRRNVFDINRPLSDQSNLFYSSERARQLALSGEQYLRDQYNAQAAVQSQLQSISQQTAQQKLDAQNSLIQEEQAAYQRAVAQAMAAAGF